MSRRALGQAKIIPGFLAPSYVPAGRRLPDYGELQRRGLPIAPYIEHGSYRTQTPSILRYGLDPYRGVMGTTADLGVQRAAALPSSLDPILGVYRILRPLAAAAMAYHGYRRHRGSYGWAIAWMFAGGAFPLVAPALALAQGFGKPMAQRT